MKKIRPIAALLLWLAIVTTGFAQASQQPSDEIVQLLHAAVQLKDAASISALDMAVERAKVIHDRAGEALGQGLIGAAYFRLSQYQLAIERLEAALAIQKELGQTAEFATTLADLGSAYNRLGQTDKALGMLLQAAEIQKSGPNTSAYADTLDDLGGVYVTLAVPDKALDCFKKGSGDSTIHKG